MRLVIQRIKNAKLCVNNKTISEVKRGLMVMVGVCEGDNLQKAQKAANKIANLRIFDDINDKLNLSVLDVKGEVMLVSNFTLCTVDTSGHRPSFSFSADREIALNLYEQVASELDVLGVPVKLGVFGADMQIDAHLDGPITIYKEI